MADSKVIDRFFGDASTPIEWAGEEEKSLHFWLDDLHCPQPISPMWFDVGGWWLTCDYMYRRFGVPFGKDWVAKNVAGYVHSAVVPRDPKEATELGAYFGMVMPIYADQFLDWWKRRYLPEILRNFEFLDTYAMDAASLPELMILLEDALDIQERHFRLHWVLNIAQFQSAMSFQAVFNEYIGQQHGALIGRILISDEDRNWDSIRELWLLKETVKASKTLTAAFRMHETAVGVLGALTESAGRPRVTQADRRVQDGVRQQSDLHARVHIHHVARESNPDRRRRCAATWTPTTTTKRTCANSARTAPLRSPRCGRYFRPTVRQRTKRSCKSRSTSRSR